jgi:hypothetical protein
MIFDLESDGADPCGVMLDEGKDGVRIIVPWSMALPERVSEPIPVLGLDMETRTFYPNHPDYFDLVAGMVGRSHALGLVLDTEKVPVAA